MDISQLFPSKYLKADDLPDCDIDATIAGLRQQRLDDGSLKPVIEFRERDLKPLLCNRTNAEMIARALGSTDTRNWRGRQITLYRSQTEYRGQLVNCIRVRERAPRVIDHRRDWQAPLEREPRQLDAAQRHELAERQARAARPLPSDRRPEDDPFPGTAAGEPAAEPRRGDDYIPF